MPKPKMVYHIPITKARVNLGALTQRAHLKHEYFILEKDGIPVAGIINVDELEDYLELRDPKLKKQIADGYAEYRRGAGRSFDLFLETLPVGPGKGGRTVAKARAKK